MLAKPRLIIGWILTVLIGLFLIGASGIPKFMDFPQKDEMMAKLGIPVYLLPSLGVLVISITVLYLIPRTAFLGAVLITGYLGGAIFTHLRIGDPWWFPIMIGVLMWVGLALRQPVLFSLLLGQQINAKSSGCAP